MSTLRLVQVALPVPLPQLFDYLPPSGGSLPPVGARVLVPLGRRRLVGVVVGQADRSELPAGRLLPVIETLGDGQVLLDAGLLGLLRWCWQYYKHAPGEVVVGALPPALRGAAAHLPAPPLQYRLTSAGRERLQQPPGRAPVQYEMLAALAAGPCRDDALGSIGCQWRKTLAGLLEKGWVTGEPVPDDRLCAVPGPPLTRDQEAAVAAVMADIGRFRCHLLDGVTGSGKTEVYLRLLESVLDAGGQALVLVPEIGLTPQLVTRLRKRLGIDPALLHSGLSDLERLRSWRQARNGDAKLVVGTRSAVFTPLTDAGLVIVDEEHDHSFKQQEGLRYSARDLAIARAKHLDIPIVLGSATPTLEMLHHCEAGNYSHLSLPRRAGAAQPPAIRIVDLGRTVSTEGLSETLAQAITQHLEESGQVLIYLNRRGFAPTLICSGCGHVAECPRCDSRMTVHAKEGRLRCHHCGSARPLDANCGECGAAMRPLGEGTQRLEDELVRRYPGRSVMRIDSDSTQRKGAMDEALQRATSGDADILVGTQMLSKGHHFPKLTLVGIVNADQGLFGTDFRSDERLAQSIIQVAGRAGRESRIGEVIIQTAFPAHPFWQRLIEGGYPRVAEDALEERRAANWPPFSRLALLRSAATRRGDAHAFLDVAAGFVGRLAGGRLRVLGPVDAPMARRAGRYRAQLLLQSADRRLLHEVLRELRPLLEADPSARKVRWSIDVDPVELF